MSAEKIHQPTGKKEKIEPDEIEDKKRKEFTDKKKEQERKEFHDKRYPPPQQSPEELEEEQQKREYALLRAKYMLPRAVRLLNLIIGLATVVLAGVSLIYASETVEGAILILTILVAILGLSWFINAFYDRQIGGTIRLLRFAISLVLVAIASIMYLVPSFGEGMLFGLLAVAVAGQGFTRIVVARAHNAYPQWLQTAHLVIGVAAIVLAIVAFLAVVTDIGLPISTITLLVSGLVLLGFARLSMGIMGLQEKELS